MGLWSTIMAAIAWIALAAAAVFLLAGPQRIWALAGPADLGPVAFETLQRRQSPNDALACPPETCIAKSDLTPPVFPLSVDLLRETFAKVIASEPRIERVAIDEAALTERYIQRTRLMGFPDTVVVRFLDLGNGRSTIALYSRSQLGKGDLGVNRARIERWLDKLAKEALAAKSA